MSKKCPSFVLLILFYHNLFCQVINFDIYPVNTHVTDQTFLNSGIIFPIDGFIKGSIQSLKAHSGNNYYTHYIGENFSYKSSFQINFATPQKNVKLYSGVDKITFGSATPSGTLFAYDLGGRLVGSDGPKIVSDGIINTPFEIKANSSIISSIKLKIINSSDPSQSDFVENIDDLEFSGGGTINPPDLIPMIAINSPTSNNTLLVNSVAISGVVQGANLSSECTILVQSLGEPGKPYAPANPITVPLTIATSGKQFSALINPNKIGRYKIIVTVKTQSGLVGSQSVEFNYLFKSIYDKSVIVQYGDLIYGITDNNCSIAVFTNGAICESGAQLMTVDGPIFTKWRKWVQAKWSMSYGIGIGICPSANSKISVSGATVQDFKSGRIYANLPDGNTYYVPKVFVNAIDADFITGVPDEFYPVSDPKQCINANTYLFQQFKRKNDLSPSTFEIKGSPPILYTEIPGGNLRTYRSEGFPMTSNLPTIVNTFSCQGNSGPCEIVSNKAGFLTNVKSYCNGEFGITREWPAVYTHYTVTPLEGIITNSHKADNDNPSTHETNIGGSAGNNWSDYNLNVVPFSNFKVAERNQKDIEIEFEYQTCYKCFTFTFNYFPSKGDLYQAGGRLIVDCGHADNVQTEIHPPFYQAITRTEKGYTNADETVARIWVNGYYPGTPSQLVFYPPPRPTPNANIVVTKTQEQPLNVSVAYSTDPAAISFVTFKISGPIKQVRVDYSGMMHHNWQRYYCGIMRLGWRQQTQFTITDKLDSYWWP